MAKQQITPRTNAEIVDQIRMMRALVTEGTHVQHLGSPGMFGVVVRLEPHMYATDPIHVDVLVRWDDDAPSALLAGKVSRSGFSSLRVV